MHFLSGYAASLQCRTCVDICSSGRLQLQHSSEATRLPAPHASVLVWQRLCGSEQPSAAVRVSGAS